MLIRKTGRSSLLIVLSHDDLLSLCDACPHPCPTGVYSLEQAMACLRQRYSGYAITFRVSN